MKHKDRRDGQRRELRAGQESKEDARRLAGRELKMRKKDYKRTKKLNHGDWHRAGASFCLALVLKRLCYMYVFLCFGMLYVML
jgi:hypothetical protein